MGQEFTVPGISSIGGTGRDQRLDVPVTPSGDALLQLNGAQLQLDGADLTLGAP